MAKHTPSVQDGATELVGAIADDITSSLPRNISLEKFRSVFVTAALHNPDILNCDPKTVQAALLKCAQDNLLPDGREAAIIPYNVTTKVDGRKITVLTAQYTPMIQGVRKRAKELGGIPEIIAECVYENDTFDYSLGDEPFIQHKPARLGSERGSIIGAYAIFKDDTNRVVHRDVMSRDDIEKARGVSKNREGDLWNKWYSEACKKTVVRRGAKGVPSIPDALRLIVTRDDEHVDFALPALPGRGHGNPLIEARANPSSQEDLRHRPDEATGRHGAGGKAGESGEPPAPKTAELVNRELLQQFSHYLLRFKGENLPKARADFWKKHPTDDGIPQAETDLEQRIFAAHVQKDRGLIAASDLTAHINDLLQEVYECTSS